MSAPADPPVSVPLPRSVLFAAPVLLILTAFVQIGLTRAGLLTPWRGGGFGLFSTVDKMENRILLVWVEAPGGEEAITLNEFEYETQNALAFPYQRCLRDLGERIAAQQGKGTAVRVEVWKRTFDPVTGESRRVLVASATVPIAS